MRLPPVRSARMDLPIRKKLPHTIPQWVAEGSWFFITINCVPPGKHQLCRAGSGDAVLAAMKFNHERLRLALPPLSAHARSSARDHRLRNHHELKEKTRYVLMNPVRKRLCERAEDWVWIYRPNDPPPPLLG